MPAGLEDFLEEAAWSPWWEIAVTSTVGQGSHWTVGLSGRPRGVKRPWDQRQEGSLRKFPGEAWIQALLAVGNMAGMLS